MSALPSRNKAAASVRSASEGSACTKVGATPHAHVSKTTKLMGPERMPVVHTITDGDGFKLHSRSPMNASELPPLIGGRYKPRRKLGEGSMGFVFEVEHAATLDRLALKVMRTHS